MNRTRPLTLAVFVNEIFWFDGRHYSTDAAFIRFVSAFGACFDRILIYDRVAKERKLETYVLDPARMSVVPLPWYEDDYALGRRALSVFPGALRTLARTAHEWDLLWMFAPHPLSLAFAGLCRRWKKPYFLTVRQNLVEQVRHRNTGVKRWIHMAIVWTLERRFMALAARRPTFTVGDEMYRRYKRKSNLVFPAAISLVSAGDVGRGRQRDGFADGNLRLLSVGRLDPEKGLPYLLQAVKQLSADSRLRITWRLVGSGREEARLKREAAGLGLDQRVEFLGYVGFGADLLKIYEESDVFVLPSLTGEGLPQVLLEAMACGVPVVATRVGGIPQLVSDGENGILIDPADSGQIAGAVLRFVNDAALRHRIVEGGTRTAREHTIEAEVERMASVLRQCFPGLGI